MSESGAHHHAARSRIPVWLALVLAIVSGALAAVQARINGELGQRLDDGFAAATISFGSGLIILLVALAVFRPGRDGFRRVATGLRDGRLRWWMLLGGTAGALLVLTQGLTVAVLGVALFSVATVAGQTLGGLLIDLTGIVPGGRRALSVQRVAGAVIATAGVIWAVSGRLQGDVPVWMLVLPFVAGLALGWQQAVNGRVRAVAQSALTATVGNFAVGTVVLVVAFLVHALVEGWPEALPSEPWLYLGGAIGCVFIAAAAVLVHVTGALLLSLGMIAGQLLCAAAIDVIMPGTAAPLGLPTIAGIILALAAVVVASVRRPRSRSRVSRGS